jgi:hypothetical protein
VATAFCLQRFSRSDDCVWFAGIKLLLDENRTYKLKQNFCHMKLRETRTFMEETQIAVGKINELYIESKSL